MWIDLDKESFLNSTKVLSLFGSIRADFSLDIKREEKLMVNGKDKAKELK